MRRRIPCPSGCTRHRPLLPVLRAPLDSGTAGGSRGAGTRRDRTHPPCWIEHCPKRGADTGGAGHRGAGGSRRHCQTEFDLGAPRNWGEGLLLLRGDDAVGSTPAKFPSVSVFAVAPKPARLGVFVRCRRHVSEDWFCVLRRGICDRASAPPSLGHGASLAEQARAARLEHLFWRLAAIRSPSRSTRARSPSKCGSKSPSGWRWASPTGQYWTHTSACTGAKYWWTRAAYRPGGLPGSPG